MKQTKRLRWLPTFLKMAARSWQNVLQKMRWILLSIDNCTAHNFITCNNKCEICIFSLKHDIRLQPMGQGVIKNFKHFYRSTVVQKILGEENIDANGTIKINILQATWMCNSAWDQVKPATIALLLKSRLCSQGRSDCWRYWRNSNQQYCLGRIRGNKSRLTTTVNNL